ncbi:MAG: hypothetical protein ABSH47_25240 [Bryobacteraceae bacterium]
MLESGDQLIDWGLRSTKKADSQKAARIIGRLVDQFRPDLLALENWEASGSRRCERVEKLLDKIAVAEKKRVHVRLVSRRELRAIGPLPLVNTKYGRASFLAERFPEVRAFLPPFRKLYMSEDDRMAIFDALGFAVACFPKPAAASDEPAAGTDGAPAGGAQRFDKAA